MAALTASMAAFTARSDRHPTQRLTQHPTQCLTQHATQFLAQHPIPFLTQGQRPPRKVRSRVSVSHAAQYFMQGKRLLGVRALKGG